MIARLIKQHVDVLICIMLAGMVLGTMLLPGYVITLDMPWTPHVSAAWNADSPNNLFPVLTVLHALSLVMPSWVVQKVLLVVIFFLLFYIPWRFLPFVEGASARMFAAGVFALNPFVYSRMLAGQWAVLLGYALLPVVLYALVRMVAEPGRRSALVLGGALTAVGFASVHYLYLSCLISVAWLGAHVVYAWWRGDAPRVRKVVFYALAAGAGFVVINLFWIVPATLRPTPLEARFDAQHFAAFTAVGNGAVPVMWNVAALGGFWGENIGWRYYFAWPQAEPVFWIAVIMLWLLVLYGAWVLYTHGSDRKKERSDHTARFSALVLVALGIAAYCPALGVADTPFRPITEFLYNHLPLWNGLRDSHKIAGVLALVYAVCAGAGVSAALAALRVRSVSAESFASVALLAIPALMGMYMWGGMHDELRPVWYPQGWYEAKAALDALPAGARVLVLPWHGYLSLDFARNRVASNPAESFFGADRVVVSRSVEFGTVHDQEVDPAYRDMDTFVESAQGLTPAELTAGLKKRGIAGILVLTNHAIPHSEEGLTHWTHFSPNDKDIHSLESDKTWAAMLPNGTITHLSDTSVVLMKI